MEKVKVKTLSKCQDCDGQTYLPSVMGVDSRGDGYQRYLTCPTIHGISGYSQNPLRLIIARVIALVICHRLIVVPTRGPNNQQTALRLPTLFYQLIDFRFYTVYIVCRLINRNYCISQNNPLFTKPLID